MIVTFSMGQLGFRALGTLCMFIAWRLYPEKAAHAYSQVDDSAQLWFYFKNHNLTVIFLSSIISHWFLIIFDSAVRVRYSQFFISIRYSAKPAKIKKMNFDREVPDWSSKLYNHCRCCHSLKHLDITFNSLCPYAIFKSCSICTMLL